MERSNKSMLLTSISVQNSERIDYLSKEVLPTVKDAMFSITKYLQTTDVTEQYKTRNFHKKILNFLKEKELDNAKLKEELGSDYESDNSSDRFNEMIEEEKSQKANHDEEEVFSEDIEEKDIFDTEREKHEQMMNEKFEVLNLPKKKLKDKLEAITKEELYNPLKHFIEILKELHVKNSTSRPNSSRSRTQILKNLNYLS